MDKIELLKKLDELHDKWIADASKCVGRSYEDAMYKCINELADAIREFEIADDSIKSGVHVKRSSGPISVHQEMDVVLPGATVIGLKIDSIG